MEDLGKKHTSLVDCLTSPNNESGAIAGLTRFVHAISALHITASGKTTEYHTILQRIHPKADTWKDDLKFTLGDLLNNLHNAHNKCAMLCTPEIIEEATQVITSMLTPGPFTTLIHGDICPDNVYDDASLNKMQIIDFEWSLTRHALLDGTYLRMSMPTCWCAKSIPTKIIAPLEKQYRQVLQTTIPAALDDELYNTAYVQACGFWALRTLYHITQAWDAEEVCPSGPVPESAEWDPAKNLFRPRVISRLQTFIEVSSQHDQLPYLRKMADSMLTILDGQWNNACTLEHYAAFSIFPNKH